MAQKAVCAPRSCIFCQPSPSGSTAPAPSAPLNYLRPCKCNVTEAALEVGHSSLSYFSQAFHEMFGCCPGLYPMRTPSQLPPPSKLASDA